MQLHVCDAGFAAQSRARTRQPVLVPASWCLVLPVLLAGSSVLAQTPPRRPGKAVLRTDSLAGTSVLAQTPPARTADELVRGKKLFEGQCGRCHGMKGAGGMGADLTRPKLRHAVDDQDLFSVIQEGIPGTAMSGNWFLTDREIWQVVGYVRSLGRTAAEPPPGDPEKGKLVYEQGECAKCHIIGGKGGGAGPDLTETGARRGLDFLRKAILHPGEEPLLDPSGYTTYLVVIVATQEGRVMTGMRMNEDTFTIQLRDEQLRFYSFRKRDLEALKKTDGSLMPSYEDKLSRTELDHLISYLASLREKP